MEHFFKLFRSDEARQLARDALRATEYQHWSLASHYWTWAYQREKRFRDEENERCK